MGVRERLADLEIELPAATAPVASYVPVRVAGNLAFVAGQVPMEEGAPMATGRLGAEISVEEGAALARRCALQALAALDEHLGLERVRGILKLSVFISSVEGFIEQAKIGNGASDVLVEVFGEQGRHARTSVSVPALPLGVPVEVEVTAEVG